MQEEQFTGVFSDGISRIDVVLVMRKSNYPEVEEIIAKFLTNILKSGLQIEIVPGVMKLHETLIFVKVHAPDSVLEHYANKFGVKRHVKNRFDFITPKRTFIENIFAFTKIQHEREWLKLVRKSYQEPLLFSNAERSLIVYKILLLLPFGNHTNYLGLNRLQKKKIILDAYALHDGPYFFLPNQDFSRVNARQILCYNWVGLKNLFKVQPLDLIHEYFGPRVGFYFAFYGFYNQALAVAALAGVLTTCLEIYDTTDEGLKNDTCEADENVWICPECEMFNICPFRKLKDYCEMVSLNIFLDNPFTLFFSIFIVLWATIFVIFWKRREHYWNWMWELHKHNVIYQRTIRPDFEIDYSKIAISKSTGIPKYYESGIRKILHFIISKCVLLICISGIVCFIALSLLAKDQLRSAFSKNLKTTMHQLIFLSIFQTVYVVLVTIIEKFCKIICYRLADFENHRTYKSYERSLVIKLFGYNLAFTFSIIVYLAWLKGLYFLLPVHSNLSYIPRNFFYEEASEWLQNLTILKRNCGPFSCINDLWILLLIVLFLKQIIFKIFGYMTSLGTDYNQKLYRKELKVPCWERQYRLKAVSEEVMMDKFNTLAQQFGLVTLFVSAFPLAPLFALMINIWDIRYHARLFLLNSRRPLLLRRSGLGAWTSIFTFISFLAILSNAFTLLRDTRTILRLYYFSKFGNMTGFLNYTLVSFPTKYYNESTDYANNIKKYKGQIPDICYFPGLLADGHIVKRDEKTIYDSHLFYNHPDFTVKYEYSTIRFYETLFVFLYEHILLCIVVLLHYFIPSHPSELKETQLIENKREGKYLHRNEEKMN